MSFAKSSTETTSSFTTKCRQRTWKGGNSLTHITLIMTIEDTFKIKFTTREVMGFQNVGEMLDCLRGKLAK